MSWTKDLLETLVKASPFPEFVCEPKHVIIFGMYWLLSSLCIGHCRARWCPDIRIRAARRGQEVLKRVGRMWKSISTRLEPKEPPKLREFIFEKSFFISKL